MMYRKFSLPLCLVLTSLLLWLSACDAPTPEAATPTEPVFTSTIAPSPTATPTPSPTPVPLAALVNAEPVTLAEFEAELARFQAARQALPDVPLAPGINLATEADVRLYVLDELINQRLFAQAAYAAGFSLSQEALQARLDQLQADMGGQQALQDYLSANQYTLDGFRAELERSAAAAWMRDQLLAAFPVTAEQIHARQILLYNQEQADQVLQQIRSGQDFTGLAYYYDPATGGDLGWFPRGYLLQPALEEAAFQLQPGSYSEVIATPLGYHILLVIAREADRRLELDALRVLQRQALGTWLNEQRDLANIQILLP
jgi:parvulin-like peptidyl-prolyl isomerase